MKKKDILNRMSGKNRRSVLKSIGVGFTGMVGITSNASADPNRDSTAANQNGTSSMRRLHGDILLINNSSKERSVKVDVRRITPGNSNPTIFSKVYQIPGMDPESNDNDNITVQDKSMKFGTPGVFVIDVKSDDVSDSKRIYNPTGSIRENERINIDVRKDQIKVSQDIA